MKKPEPGTVIGRIRLEPHPIDYSLPIVRFREDRNTIIFCPALNLSGYGNTLKEAEHAFGITLKIYLKDTTESGTLKEDLKSLGWTINEEIVKPPQISKLISRNPEFKKIINNRVYTQAYKKIQLPVWPKTSKTLA